ncbi:TspO/MBR family protein [Rhodohalobacter barkolensis]|nr:TspO/MBR family protein [Rhodohalobacter barkolensis]
MRTAKLTLPVQIMGLLFWLILCYLVAWTGAQVSPGIASPEWYNALNKPTWNPPAWLFGPVWSALYTMMGIAAWLIWKDYGIKHAKPAIIVFLIQLALNGLWSQLFFNFQALGWALIEIIILLGAIFITTYLFFQKNRAAGWLMVPYILWVSFATALTVAIWVLN